MLNSQQAGRPRAEYLALVAAVQFALWSMQLLKEIGVVLPDRFELFCDSESAAAIAAHFAEIRWQ